MTTVYHPRSRIWVLLTALSSAACAGSARGPEAPLVVAGSVCSGVHGLGPQSLGAGPLASAKARAGLIAVLGVAAEPSAPAELAVMELGGQRLRWKRAVHATGRPQILEDVVVISSGDMLVAYDLASGAERFRSPLGRPLWLGAAQSGRTILVTAGAAAWDPKQRGGSLIALDADSGEWRWHRDVPYALSAPVIHAQRALVVADHADLWTLDLATGADTGCGPLSGNTVEWLEAAPDGLVFGSAEARALGADASERKPAFELPRQDLPGRPFIRASSYLPVPAERSAHGRVAAIAPLRTTEHGPTLAGDAFYFVFYRDVFGFRADGGMTWAQVLDADIVRAQASEAALWVVTETGVLLQLDAATGAPRTSQALGLRVSSADIVPGTSAAPAAVTTAPPMAAEAALQPSLRRVADDTDARLLPARLFAVDELAKLEAPDASADLLAVYDAPNTPSALRDRIATRLRERTRGAEYLMAALAEHEDFIEERRAPPLRAIVPGLVTQRETRATAGLVAHLFDPDTPAADLGMLVSALDTLGGDGAREPLRRFFAMYHADSALAGDTSPLLLATRALLARDDAQGRALAISARDSALTLPALREQLASLLAPPPPVAPEQVTEVAAAPEAPPPPPTELRTLLEAARPQLAPCVSAAEARNPKLNAVRLWFVAEPGGSVRDVHVTPIDAELASCLAVKLRELSFVTAHKQLVSFQLAVQPNTVAAPASLGDDASDEFWVQAQKRAPKTLSHPLGPPWWLDKNPLFVVIDQPATATTPAAAAPAASPLAPAPAKPAAPTGDDTWWLPTQNSKR